MQVQSIDDEYEAHKDSVIHLAQAEIDGKITGSKKHHIEAMIVILQKYQKYCAEVLQTRHRQLRGDVQFQLNSA